MEFLFCIEYFMDRAVVMTLDELWRGKTEEVSYASALQAQKLGKAWPGGVEGSRGLPPHLSLP